MQSVGNRKDDQQETGYFSEHAESQPNVIFPGDGIWKKRRHRRRITDVTFHDEQPQWSRNIAKFKDEQPKCTEQKETNSDSKDKCTDFVEKPNVSLNNSILNRVKEHFRINIEEKGTDRKNADYLRLKQTEPNSELNVDGSTRLQINSDIFKCFGEISSDKRRPYKGPAYFTVLKRNADPDLVFQFLTQAWNIPPPKLLLSILGGANTLVLRNKDIEKIKKGLILATASTGAWIVTGGTKSGVMQIVGEAVQEHMQRTNGNIIPIGIAQLGIIKEKNELSGYNEKEQKRMHLSYNVKDSSTNVSLDLNHSYFVLVDTEAMGQRNQIFGKETKFRFSLEKELSQQCGEKIKIPVVKIIIGGGIRALKAVKKSLIDQIPVLVVDGSGRAANFISRAIQIYNKKNSKNTCTLTEFAGKAFGTEQKENALSILNFIMRKRNNQLIHVYSLEETTRTLSSVLQDILFLEFFKGLESKNEEEILKQKLDLVDGWKRSDIAEEEIFKALRQQSFPVKKMCPIFLSALKDNRQDFVELILNYVTNLKDFLHGESAENEKKTLAKILDVLYEHHTNTKTGSSAGQLISNKILKLEQTLSKCCNDSGDNSKIKELPHKLRQIYKVVKALFDGREIYSFEDWSNMDEHIFIWAIMMNQKDMSMIFWPRGTNFICTALIASCLLKSLSDIAFSEADMELSTSYGDNSRYFESLAYNLLDNIYSKNRSVCQDLLVTKVEKYGSTTPLALSALKSLKNFMGHTACQTTLNTIWKGDILTYISTLKIIAIFFLCPVLAPRYMTNETKTSHLSNKVGTTSNKNNEIATLKQKLFCFTSNCSLKHIFEFLLKLKTFYSAPISKFISNVVSYLAFLVIFCLMVLTDLKSFNEGMPSVLEILTWLWIMTMIIEEIRQALHNQVPILTSSQQKTSLKSILFKHNISLKDKLYGWISDVWNLFDVVMYILFVTSVLLRFLLSVENFCYARWAYAITLGMHIIRSMQFFMMSRNIGPKVIMIGRMTKDIMFFIILFAVFVFTFGVMYQAILFPNSRPTTQLFKDIIYYPYWQLYGELFLETIEGKEPAVCTSDPALYLNGTMVRCANSSWANSLLLAVYLILSNILLINILIAMFSYSFQKIHNNSTHIWKFHRFRLIHEFYYKSTLAPPLNILNYLYRRIKRCGNYTENDKFNKCATEVELDQIHLLEKDAVENCLMVSSELDRYRGTIVQSSDESDVEDPELDADLDQSETLQSPRKTRQELQSSQEIRLIQSLCQNEMISLTDSRKRPPGIKQKRSSVFW